VTWGRDDALSLQLFLSHLWAVVGGITHNLALVDWGLTATIRGTGASRWTFSTSLDEDMSLQCIFPREALLAMAAGEWLDC